MATQPALGHRNRSCPLLVVPVEAVDDRIADLIGPWQLPKAEIVLRFVTRVQPSTVDQVVGRIGYVVRLYIRIQSLNVGGRRRIERLRDRPTIPIRTQGGRHVGVDGVGAAAAPYRVAAAAAEDHIRIVAVGDVVVTAVSEHVVFAAHRKDPVVSGGAEDPILAAGALARLMLLTAYDIQRLAMH